jgi:hypothetical protein
MSGDEASGVPDPMLVGHAECVVAGVIRSPYAPQ